MDDLRFARTDAGMNGLISPPRNSTRLPQSMSAHDSRTSLPRRFTTDSGRVPTLSNILLPRGPEQPQEYASVRCFFKLQAFGESFLRDQITFVSLGSFLTSNACCISWE